MATAQNGVYPKSGGRTRRSVLCRLGLHRFRPVAWLDVAIVGHFGQSLRCRCGARRHRWVPMRRL